MELDFALLVLAGFLAQLVDGALGMGFGVVGATLMLSFGHAPATASAMVHIAQIFTTGASGLSHVIARNVRLSTVVPLTLGGVIGGALGAAFLSSVDGDIVRPVVIAYLAVMGVMILWRTARRTGAAAEPEKPWHLRTLGLAGGFLDSFGGGWGPIVTGTLVGRGHQPRFVVGSVNAAEFIVKLVISATFVAALGVSDLKPVLGFLLGGVAAAPLAGLVVRVAPLPPMRVAVGVLVLAICAIQSLKMVAG
jgi:hypothetical protein